VLYIFFILKEAHGKNASDEKNMKEIHYGLVNEYLKVLIKNTYFMFKLKLKILCACSNTNPTTQKLNKS